MAAPKSRLRPSARRPPSQALSSRWRGKPVEARPAIQVEFSVGQGHAQAVVAQFVQAKGKVVLQGPARAGQSSACGRVVGRAVLSGKG